ncbi:hypothetical protein H920_08975 [Fukomys damarensis]|uniref:Immortalization up-regulated protein n=1 Tax=Fukomys damarensis TaxID=885580 RepID=A0A091DEV3_FUKDA|nr:hypothetical protein H920_08975 [Fukomys damarensis]
MDFSLAAALDSNSKKLEGACKLGDPKHVPPKAHGGPGAPQKPRPHAAGSQKHKGTADKPKKPKMKKDKDKRKKGKEAAH